MVKWLLFAFTAFVVAEAAAFILVSEAIGLPKALLLMLATSLAGFAVLRHLGRALLNRLHESVSRNGVVGLEAGGDAFLTVSAGFLLLIPGFLTDAAGLLLLLPPIRHWIGGRFEGFARTRQQTPGVVDLEPDQWQQVPERQIGDRREPNHTQ